MNRFTTFVVALILVTTTAGVALAQVYSEIVAFGASLTDGGNVYDASPPFLGFNFPVSPPNYMGRFSNGPSWVDNLADLVGVERPIASRTGGNNYAHSGATTGAVVNCFEEPFPGGIVDMDAQVATYLSEKTVSGDELFVVVGWTAINDFSNCHPEPAEPEDSARYVGQAIRDLASAGANNLFVPLGMTSPRVGLPVEMVAAYNDFLLNEIDSARLANPGASILTFDPQPTNDSFYANPSSIGVRFLTGQACNDCTPGNPNPVQIADNPNEYLYWEGNHFTEPANAALGRAAYETLVPEPASATLIALGIVLLGRFQRAHLPNLGRLRRC